MNSSSERKSERAQNGTRNERATGSRTSFLEDCFLPCRLSLSSGSRLRRHRLLRDWIRATHLLTKPPPCWYGRSCSATHPFYLSALVKEIKILRQMTGSREWQGDETGGVLNYYTITRPHSIKGNMIVCMCFCAWREI